MGGAASGSECSEYPVYANQSIDTSTSKWTSIDVSEVITDVESTQGGYVCSGTNYTTSMKLARYNTTDNYKIDGGYLAVDSIS